MVPAFFVLGSPLAERHQTFATNTRKTYIVTMNPFLSKIKTALSESGVPVELAGEQMIVVNPTQAQYRDMLVSAEQRAKADLEENEEKLRSKKLTADEKKELLQLGKSAGMEIGDAETKYDRDLIMLRLQNFTRLMVAESVRNPDGSKTWETKQERDEIADALLALPGAEETIMAALRIAAKKNTTSNGKAQTKSRRKSSAGSKSAGGQD